MRPSGSFSRRRTPASIATAARDFAAADESTAHDLATESIWHSALSADPSGGAVVVVPSPIPGAIPGRRLHGGAQLLRLASERLRPSAVAEARGHAEVLPARGSTGCFPQVGRRRGSEAEMPPRFCDSGDVARIGQIRRVECGLILAETLRISCKRQGGEAMQTESRRGDEGGPVGGGRETVVQAEHPPDGGSPYLDALRELQQRESEIVRMRRRSSRLRSVWSTGKPSTLSTAAPASRRKSRWSAVRSTPRPGRPPSNSPIRWPRGTRPPRSPGRRGLTSPGRPAPACRRRHEPSGTISCWHSLRDRECAPDAR